MNRKLLKKYAELIVTTGINLEKGQDVNIVASVDQYRFAELVVEYCYKYGAREVTVDWSDQKIAKMHYLNQTLETLSECPKWRIEKVKHQMNTLPCRIYIDSDDPDGLSGIDIAKVQKSRLALMKKIKKYRDMMDNKYQWVIVAVPSKAWAKKVFPDLSPAKAVEKLWESIFETVHISADNDPVKEWEIHNMNFKERCEKLNSMKLVKLVYRSSNGTDFTVGLNTKCKWEGGGGTSLTGHFYNPNMPTEEIFTSPMKGIAKGRLVATKPLSYNGRLISDFYIDFEDGKAVSFDAKAGKDTLAEIINFDKGSAMLGEVALVPFDSPINNQNILYYNTLFDENASCHVALGMGFTDLYEGYEKMTKKEIHEKGINDSMIHVDFMIGSDDMSIKGYDDKGKEYVIFENGNFAI